MQNAETRFEAAGGKRSQRPYMEYRGLFTASLNPATKLIQVNPTIEVRAGRAAKQNETKNQTGNRDGGTPSLPAIYYEYDNKRQNWPAAEGGAGGFEPADGEWRKGPDAGGLANRLEPVRAILQEQFNGQPITEQNLSGDTAVQRDKNDPASRPIESNAPVHRNRDFRGEPI